MLLDLWNLLTGGSTPVVGACLHITLSGPEVTLTTLPSTTVTLTVREC